MKLRSKPSTIRSFSPSSLHGHPSRLHYEEDHYPAFPLDSEKDQLYHNVHVAQKNKEYRSAIACYDRRQTRSPRFVSKRSASAPLDFASSMKNWAPHLIMEEVSSDLGHLSRNTTDLNEKCKNVRRDTGAFRGIISFDGFMSLGSL